jgi:tetratricopeptide (TPR) repeat protein
MPGPPTSSRRDAGIEERSAVIHQEIVKLSVLIVLAIAAFFVTRAIAENNSATMRHDAAEWYARGQRAMIGGDAATAVDAFRHANVMKRGDRQYGLDLARSLVATGQIDAARSTLLALRESAPEDPETNLELARIDAGRHDVTNAVRYYHNALYAPWPVEETDRRRLVRLELIRMLLTTGQSSRAESELVALAADLPDDLRTHLEVGNLFTAVGNHRRALDQFQAALRLAPRDGTALAGAGRAAFEVGDYPLAQRYLREAPDQTGALSETRDLVERVLSQDPLAPRIGSSARRARLVEALSHVEQHLTSCVASRPDAARLTRLPELLDEAHQFSTELTRSRLLENDTIEDGLELVDRGARAVTTTCPPAELPDRALMLIAERHGVSSQ